MSSSSDFIGTRDDDDVVTVVVVVVIVVVDVDVVAVVVVVAACSCALTRACVRIDKCSRQGEICRSNEISSVSRRMQLVFFRVSRLSCCVDPKVLIKGRSSNGPSSASDSSWEASWRWRSWSVVVVGKEMDVGRL